MHVILFKIKYYNEDTKETENKSAQKLIQNETQQQQQSESVH